MFSNFRKFVVLAGLLFGLSPVVVQAQTFVDMVEYRNAEFDYYFYTARQGEQASLDSLDVWSRTGGSFKVAQQQQVGTVPLTRFFFSEIAKNRARGSHFYASSDGERAALRALNPANSTTPRLPQDEGLFAHVYPAGSDSTAGECPVATSPVYRLFRGEPTFADDGNHRYVRKQDVYAEAISRGWIPEGVAFCAPDILETSITLSANVASPAIDVVLKPDVLALSTAVYSLPNRLTLPRGSVAVAIGQLLLVGDRSFRVTGVVSTTEAVYTVARVRPDQIYSSMQIRAGAISAAMATFQVNPALQDHLKASLCANISRRPGDDVALQSGGLPQVNACFLRENARRDPTKMRTGFSIGISKLKHGDAVISGDIALLIQDDPITVKADLLKALISGEDAIESADIDFVLTGRAKFAAEIGRSINAVPGSGIQPTELNAPLGHISIGLGYGIVFRVPVYLVVDTAKIDIKGTLNFDAELDIGIKMSYGLLPSGGKGWRQVPPLSVNLASVASNESTVAFFDASVDASAKLRAGIAATPMLTVIGMSDYLHLGLDLRLLPRLEAAARLTTKNPPLCTDYGFGLDFVARVVGQFGVWDGKIDIYDRPIGKFGREMNIKQKCGDAVSAPAGPRIVKKISPLQARRGQATSVTIDLSRADVEDVFYPPRLFVGSQACDLNRELGFSGGSASFFCTLNEAGTFGAKVYLGTSFLAANGGGDNFLVSLNPQVQSVVPVSIAEVSKVLTFSVTGRDLSGNTLLRMDNCEQTLSLGGTSTERRFSCVPARSGRQPVVVFESLNGTPLRYSEVVVDSQTLATRTAQISDLQPREARQNEVSRFTVTGTDLDAGVSLTINTCGNATRRAVSSSRVDFDCVITGSGGQRFDVLNNLGQSKLTGTINVRLPSPLNRAPSVGIPDYSRNVPVGNPFTGTFRSVDPDGDRMINQRVTVTRASDGATCKIDVGAAGVPQLAGDKVFSGCSTLATGAGSYELRADGSDYLSTTASPGLPATPTSGYIVQATSTPGVRFDGVCGTADRTTVATIPTTNLCSVGTTAGATGTGPWTWTCQGTGGGTNAPCSAQKTPTANQPPAVPSATATFDAGRSVTLTFVVTDPESGSVSADAYLSSAGGSAPYNPASKKTSAAGASGTTRTLTWTSAEIASFTTVGQTYTIRIDAFDSASNKTEKVTNSFIVTAAAVNGVCGTASGTTVSVAPTTNLCNTGSPSAVGGTGPWTWTCSATGGGTPASCSAAKAITTCAGTLTTGTYNVGQIEEKFDTLCPAGTTGQRRFFHTCQAGGTWTPVAQTDTCTAFLAAPATANVASVSTGIQLSWSIVSGATGYRVFRGGSLYTTVSSGTQSSFIDTGVSSGTNYCYTISATSTFTTPPSESTQTSGGCATFVAGPPPLVAPTGVSASVITGGIRVAWALVSGADSYVLTRLNDNVARTLGASTTSYDDVSGLSPGIGYGYAVQAKRGTEVSPQSTVVSAVAPQPLVNGVCGAANGTTVSVAPTANLCNAGTPSSVGGTGPWTWTCSGSGGGNPASCSANKTAAPSIPGTTSIISGGSTIGAPLLGGAFVFEWAASSGATYYRTLFQNTVSGSASTQDFINTTTALSAVSAVVSGQTYDWSVAACNGGGCSAYSSTRRFRRQ